LLLFGVFSFDFLFYHNFRSLGIFPFFL
jgi:hypothetical protein